ncbi:MAG: polyprenyl synthetase family protein [Pseudomonadota bacterium]
MMSNDDTDLDIFLQTCRDRCLTVLQEQLGGLHAYAPELRQAMAHATLQGGKRLRPALVYASARLAGDAGTLTDAAACAVELIHCYSLVHDDLPAMDDDDLRRGQPTVHRVFGEATAILSGDALQSLAFQVLSDGSDQPEQRLRMLHVLARASGPEGMVGGQSLDISAEQQLSGFDLEQLQLMHRLKTGALIEASVMLGALSAGLSQGRETDALHRYAQSIGLAFQVQDDILDVTGDTATLGKTGGADAARDKPTYTSLLGLDGARDKARELTAHAMETLEMFDDRADRLRQIARYITHRVH